MIKKRFIYALILLPTIILTGFNKPQEIIHNNKEAPWIVYGNSTNDNNKAPIVQKSHDGQVYYQFKCNNHLKKIFKKAINKWNKLNIIKFKPAKDNKDPNIHPIKLYGESNLSNHKVIASTFSSRTPITKTKNGNNICYYHDTKVKLNHGFNKLKQTEKVDVAAHELGHCLGFNDDDSNQYIKSDIMNPKHHRNANDLSSHEQNALKRYYSL
ncbi:hypothetical protein DY138_04275 [Apilactobacillus timberlakei]|uniref:matrixin family metalloprotease n=1 Tax=Apilactobacillus timberlakei TaxID=2008380 RepID=UPI001128E61F|nr:matrixin family metalloprotease [Apilactobacillus timberlakei]TPR18838.1 hypothetical protein DY138_04275 [Apilactobacillus timberlakei]TPR20998.1 hypothetical protein DY061_02865 [Apilactobacillus timberlakei]TPR23649.1 hypothetical protein DY083_00735 [Apilactobacillus timberlakei]